MSDSGGGVAGDSGGDGTTGDCGGGVAGDDGGGVGEAATVSISSFIP